MSTIRIVTTRAPGLIPSLIKEIDHASNPVVLIPESFTLACETEIVNRSRDKGIYDLKIFSPSSLVREIRELTGQGTKKPVTADAQNMIFSRVLHHHQDELKYYRDSVAQPTLAQKIAGQINDFTRARLNPGFLRDFDPSSRRTKAKMEDMALLWDGYKSVLGDKYEDIAGQWLSALDQIQQSGLLKNAQLLIYGFDYITHDILNLVHAAVSKPEIGNAALEVVIGLIGDDVGADRDIFRAANDSVLALMDYLRFHRIAPYTLQTEDMIPPIDPGIAYVEKSIYAHGAFASAKIYERKNDVTVIRPEPYEAKKEALEGLARTEIPDMSHVHVYYAKNSYLECQHACQTLIEWHRAGIPWEDMAIAVCEQNTLPSLLPLTLSASGIPFNAKQDQPILMSGYAQYVLSLLRVLRLNFCQNDMLRMLKTGFSPIFGPDVMDMENYIRKNGIHRSRWLKPFYIPEKEPEKEKAEHMEELRQQLITPIVQLKQQLSQKGCTGRQAATILFQFITDAGIYDKLLAQEDALAEQGDDLGIDRNRQVWTAINELLDSVVVFIGDEPLPMHDLCTMLEASMASRMIKSLPQLSQAVMVAPPQMFFSSGVRCVIVMGLQENELSTNSGILSENERSQLENYIEQANMAYYKSLREDADIPDAEDKEDTPSQADNPERPYSKIGQSLLDLAARQKQDVYQAVSLAREQLMISCSSAKPSGGVLTPAIAFKRISKVVSENHPENVTGGLMNTDIRPFVPAFALETLAVRLRDGKDNSESFLKGSTPDDLLWKNALGSLYQSEAWHDKTAGVLNGLHVSVTTEGITREQASRLYLSHSMSISRVETFGSCPWRHLLQYGLELFPTATYAYERNEQGTFNHDVIKQFLDEAMKLPEWPDLTENQINVLLNRILKEQVKKWDGGILRSDIVHRYQGVAIIHGVRTSIKSLMRSFQQKPHFLPMAAEVSFGMQDEKSRIQLPAIQIHTDDGATVAFSGRIDRIDRLDLDGQSYFMIVDNKMSTRDVKQNSIVAGLQLQLPLYIRAAQSGLEGYIAAGGLYQPVKDVLVESEDAAQITAQIDKDLQTSGIILDNKAVQEAMKPVKIARKLDTNDTISAVTPEELQTVLDCALDVVTSRVNRIRSGETAPIPLQDGPNSPCSWCDHPDACLYDSTMPGCRMRELDHKHRMDMPVRES